MLRELIVLYRNNPFWSSRGTISSTWCFVKFPHCFGFACCYYDYSLHGCIQCMEPNDGYPNSIISTIAVIRDCSYSYTTAAIQILCSSCGSRSSHIVNFVLVTCRAVIGVATCIAGMFCIIIVVCFCCYVFFLPAAMVAILDFILVFVAVVVVVMP